MITKLRFRILALYGEGEQNHIADRLNINRGRMSQYCTGIRPVTVKHLTLLCQELQCTPGDLIGYVDLESVR